MSNPLVDPGHGHSPAAWTNVIIMLIALSIAAVALFLEAWVVLAAAVVLFLLGPIVGFIMVKAGYGANGPKTTSKAH